MLQLFFGCAPNSMFTGKLLSTDWTEFNVCRTIWMMPRRRMVLCLPACKSTPALNIHTECANTHYHTYTFTSIHHIRSLTQLLYTVKTVLDWMVCFIWKINDKPSIDCVLESHTFHPSEQKNLYRNKNIKRFHFGLVERKHRMWFFFSLSMQLFMMWCVKDFLLEFHFFAYVAVFACVYIK